MIVPTRRLALVALLVGVAVAFFPAPVNGGLLEKVLVLNAIVLAAAFADVAAAPRPSAIDVRREHPPVVGLGQIATVSWSVRNGAPRRAVVAVADGFRPSLTARNRRFRLRLSGGAVGHATTTICPTRRGRFEISEVVLRVEGPLGLAARQQRRSVPTVLHVHPKFHSREEAELRIRKARILDVGLRSARGVGGGTEFEQLREYTPDDEFRRVDWSASARAGRPIVRTYRPERHQSVMVLLDNGRLMAARTGGVPRLEHAMDAAIMLAVVSTRLGDRIGLVTFDQEVRSVLAPAGHRSQVGAMTAAMFDLEPVLAESNYRDAFGHTLARFRRRSLLVLLTDLSSNSISESLLPSLPLILRHHIVLVGAVRDPDVDAWARGAATDATDAHRRAAAVAAVDERDRRAAQLVALGATVIDAPPGRLAPRLADEYLRVKSSGRL
ncbi:MAG: DUF58 domain-containing protein [Microthrixaceae bacterium]|nr:DUF58 domain-containing protein [Microthrixaceae bacterium]HMS13016.1 DUF58 domain-containing protein [Microthrixaceae bacterium]HMT25242.1 DUF58 domain-containing protein [Microthrixaceae bacterium]